MKKIFNWLLEALRIQLFLNLVALPFFVWWHIPLSFLSFFGNVIFSPFLSLFLTFSTILVFLEIIGVPNQLIALFMNKIVWLWDILLKSYKGNPLIGIPQKLSYILILLPFIALFLVQLKPKIRGTKWLFGILTGVIILLKSIPLLHFQKQLILFVFL